MAITAFGAMSPAEVRLFDELRLLAAKGDPVDQLKLGACFERGVGVAKDDAEAMRHYRMAALQGLAEAQYNLGVGYDSGRGVPKDIGQAIM